MPKLAAIIFDLYGTLLDADPRTLHREIPRALGIRPRAWLEFVRNDLLVQPFDDPVLFSKHICDVLVPEHSAAMEVECRTIVDRELARVTPKPGIYSLLAFLKRRGFKLGLLSNLSSSFKAPLERLGMTELFDAMMFSCDEGVVKPDREIYERLLARLGASAEETLFVGDSLSNDVLAPQQLGMRGIHVGECASGHECISQIGDLGWIDFREGHEGEHILAPGTSFEFLGRRLTVRALDPVADDQQGRYNLVYRVLATRDDGKETTVYCKRFLLPESGYVEELAYRMHHEIGLPSCNAEVVVRGEPFLVISSAAGVKYDGLLDRQLAYELGRHHVFAYLFSNADMRPRNAFINRAWPHATMMMIDLEHCFFNLAIDTTGVADPEKPQSMDELPEDERARRTPKKVLSERAMRRARKTFIDTESCDPDLAASFRSGFVEQFRRVQANRDALLNVMLDRVYREPYLVIGTQSYRRAMGRIDIEDIRERLELEAEKALALFC